MLQILFLKDLPGIFKMVVRNYVNPRPIRTWSMFLSIGGGRVN